MSGLSPLTMWQGNSKELMIEHNRSGKTHKLATPKFLLATSASLTRFSTYIKRHTHLRKGCKKPKNPIAVIVEASSSTVAPDSSAMPQCTKPTGTITIKQDDSKVVMPKEAHDDIVESPAAISLPTDAISHPSPSTSTTAATIASIPIEIVRNVADYLLPMDALCFGLAKKTFWEGAKTHLQVEGLYPARFIITDPWGRYSARPLVYYDLPERLESWMSPRVLFHQSTPKMFVESQARANYLKMYFRMCERQLSQPHRLLECLDRLEYKRPIWVLPDCRGYFEQWQHLGDHDREHCAICIESVRAMIPTRSHEALILSHRSNLLRSIVRVINSTFH